MTSQQLRQAVQAEFRRQQLILDKEALALVVDHVSQAGDGLAPVYTLIDRLDTDNHSRITGPIVEETLQRLGNAPAGSVNVQVFDSFDVPKVRFDHIRQRFHAVTDQLTIHAAAKDRFDMYLDRLLLLHQRLRRDKTFSKPALADADINDNNLYCQVVPGCICKLHMVKPQSMTCLCTTCPVATECYIACKLMCLALDSRCLSLHAL